jgi:Glycosyl hydrolases family 39/Abnormal spindle-like microcephaly-assoc'd, ASPM-SPD-2-Hydin
MHTTFRSLRRLPISARILSLLNVAISCSHPDVSLNRPKAVRRVRGRVPLLSVALSLCALSGTAAMAAVAASPTSLSWANVAVGGAGGQKAVMLTNGGTTALTISSIAITGANASDFSIFSKTCGTSLAVSASCTVNVVFGPTSAGARTASLQFSDNAANSPQTVALSGTGTGTGGGTVTLSPSSLAYGTVIVGATSAPQTATLKNGTTSSITIKNVAFTGTNPGNFSISSNTCGASLAASASCTVTVVFKPTTSGANSATLAISDTTSNSPQTASLSGTGSTSTNGATLSPSSLAYGTVNVGSSSASQTTTLKNVGTASITISSVAISGTNPGDFTISTKTCGASLAASASCTITTVFKPTASGARAATLKVTDTASNSPQSVALSGTGSGTTGAVTLSPSSLTYGTVNVGSSSATQTTTLKNGGSSSITISNVAITGTNPGDFSISSKTCGASLGASASCTVTVAFKPTTSGARSATLTISDTAANSPQAASLSGTGATSTTGVTVTPTSLTFATTAVGSTSAAQSTTWKNGGGTSINISTVAITGANAGDFSISSKTCGATLAASASCTASVVFKPTASGARSATLTLTDSASNSPQTVSLSGSTSSSSFTILPSNPTLVVNQTLQFSTTVAVTWSASCGSIGTTSGLYSAPSTTGSCVVTATQTGGTHLTASTTVRVTSGGTSGTLKLYPTSAAVAAGSEQIFQAQLTGVPDSHSLSYSVDGASGGSGAAGTITNAGLYTAPGGAGTHTVSVRDNSLGTTSTASVTVYSNVSVDFGSRAVTSHPIPADLFGAERLDSMHNDADLDLVKAGGISYARFYALIPTVFKTSTPNWGPIDANVRKISAGGVSVMLQIYQSPPWLQPSSNPCGAGNPNAMPTDVNAWGQMAAQYVKHMDATFPNVTIDYEIWNEPNTEALCLPPDSRLAAYMKLYAAAAPLMRNQAKADGRTPHVGGPGSAGYQNSWVKAMLADPVISKNIDYMSYHQYLFGSKEVSAQWDTYNGLMSVNQKTQNDGADPLSTYIFASHTVAAGLQPQGKNLPIYNTEYNLNWAFAKDCCRNDLTYSPVWNGLYIAEVLNSVYVGATNVPAHMVYFAANAHPYFCLIGEYNANMDCTYALGSVPQPYPEYFLYQLFGATKYLGLQNGGFMAKSISPPTLGNGLVVTAFNTTTLDAIVLVNPTSYTFTNMPINALNTGLTSPVGTLYQIVNGQSIQSSTLSLQSQSGSSYSTSVTIGPHSVQAISLH